MFRHVRWCMFGAAVALLGSSLAIGQISYDAVSFFDANFDTDSVGGTALGWSATAQNSPGSFAKVANSVSVTGANSFELKTTGKALGSSNLRRVDLASRIPISRSIECSFSVRLTSNADQQFRVMLATSSLTKIGNMQIVFKNGAIIAQYGNPTLVQTTVVPSFSANQWYDVQLHVNPAKNSYSVSVFSNGAMVGQAVDLPNSFATQPAGIFFGNDGALTNAYEHSVYVDNVMLASTPNPNLGFEATASGTTALNWTSVSQWATGSSVLVTDTQVVEGINSVELRTQASSANVPAGQNPSSTLTGQGQAAYLPASTDDSCTFNVKLSNTDQAFRFYLLDSDRRGLGNFLVWFRTDGTARVYHQLADLTTNTSTQLLSQYSANVWYKIVVTRPAGQNSFDIAVYEGGNLLTELTDLPNKFAYPIESMRFYADGVASGYTGQRSVYLDDIRISGPRIAPRQLYVSTTGNDNTNNGSIDAPFRTLYKAGNTARPGDTVNVLPGTYTETKGTTLTQIYGMATATRPIIFRSTSPQQAILSYSSPATSQKFRIKQNYVTVQDFEITQAAKETNNTADILLLFDYNSNGGTAIGNKLHGSYEECLKGDRTNNLLFKNNICYDTIHEGIDVVNGRDVTIEGNTVYQTLRNAILAKGGSRNVRIFNNYVHSGGSTMTRGIVLGGTTISTVAFDTSASGYEIFNSVAYNNTVIADTADQIDEGLAVIGGTKASFLNNVVVGAKSAIYLGKANGDIGNGWAWDPLVNDCLIQNNIFQDCSVQGVKLSSPSPIQGTYTNSYNVYYNCTNYTNVPSTYNYQSDPRFVNPISDWHFQAGPPTPPGLNSGNYVSSLPGYYGETFDVSLDPSGTQRQSPPDMGIWEQ